MTTKPKILAIDDTPANLMTLGLALRSEFFLQVATSGAMGLALAQQAPPDLILLDVMMPDMDGFEVCRQLKAIPALRDIPVIFVTALTGIESESNGLALGAVDYITKPVNVDIARQRISNLIEREILRKSVIAQKDQLQAQVIEIDLARQALVRTQEALQASDQFKHVILNSLIDEIAVLDENGVIQAVNAPWQRFANENAAESANPAAAVTTGANYLDACRQAIDLDGPDAKVASDALLGIEAVMHGTAPGFRMEYPCHSPTHIRWLSMVVSPLQESAKGGVVVAHSDITDRKLAEEALTTRMQFGNALNEVAQAIIEGQDTHPILQASTAIVGKTLAIDRVLIYEVSFAKRLICGISEWLNPHDPAVHSSLGAYPLDAFSGGISEMQRTRQPLMSQAHEVNPHFLADGSAELLHQKLAIQSLLWYPFAWSDDKFMVLVLNQLYARRDWSQQDLDFLNSVSRQVSIALTKIELMQAQRSAQEKLQLAANVFTHAREGIMITDPNGVIVEVNDAFARITGYSRQDVVGKNPRLLSSGRQGKAFYAQLWQQVIEQGHWYGEIWNRRKNGELYAEMLTISAVRDTAGKAEHLVALFSDITMLKRHEDHLDHIAHYDALTNLPNRVLLSDRLRQSMAHAQRHGKKLVVAFIDLDGFKRINDTFGHEAGDQLLIGVATRMKDALRDADTLARIGGDEFVAVLGDLDNITASVPMLTRLLAAAAQPVAFKSVKLQVSASLGVTYYPQSEEIEADHLLRQADQALYQSKLAGKNRFSFFDIEQDGEIRSIHQHMDQIRQGLAAREFVLFYQPKVNLRTGAIVSVEALIRWQHPEKGLLAPDVFLPVIENHPLAVELGEWVLGSALSQLVAWQSQGLDLVVSVNIGVRQLQQPSFVLRLQELLAAHPQVTPSQLEIEILETSALEELTRMAQVVEDCRALGVSFALDDFGTGYSSLAYLRHLRVNGLKIGQSFVHGMQNDAEDLAIVRGVIALASSFRRDISAVGIETLAQGQLLLQLGCDVAQGFYIAKPMPAHALADWAARWVPNPLWQVQTVVSAENMPLLYARVEHRSWVEAVTASLRGDRFSPPPRDAHQCSFGKWCDTEGALRFGTLPVFAAINELHQQTHTLGAELLTLQSQGQNALALTRLPELERLRDAQLQQIDALEANAK